MDIPEAADTNSAPSQCTRHEAPLRKACIFTDVAKYNIITPGYIFTFSFAVLHIKIGQKQAAGIEILKYENTNSRLL